MNQDTGKILIQSKSMAVGILLTIFFGPLGLFYSSVIGAIIMLIVSIPLAIVTAGLGFILIIPVCVIIAAVSINNHNSKLVG